MLSIKMTGPSKSELDRLFKKIEADVKKKAKADLERKYRHLPKDKRPKIIIK